MIFHEEATFRQSKELPNESDSPPSEVPGSPHSNDQREEEDEPLVQDVAIEPEMPTEELLEAPPSKRRPAWFRETLQEVEKHKAPSGTFRESKKPHKYYGLIT